MKFMTEELGMMPSHAAERRGTLRRAWTELRDEIPYDRVFISKFMATLQTSWVYASPYRLIPLFSFIYGLFEVMGVAKSQDPSASNSTPTSALLMAASKHVAVRCSKVNAAYIECKDRNNGNPSACVKEGEAVTQCVVDLLKDVHGKCPEELKTYCECMDYYSNRFSKCRKEQTAFEECAPL